MVSVLQQLVLLTAIVCQCTCVTSTCSRLLSRRVRKFLQTDVFPRLPIAPTDLPSQCQLNPIHDIYYDQEEHKSTYGSKDLRCGYCGKHFKSDLYLDRHFDNKHANTIESNRTTCLADLCPVFGCSDQNTRYKGSHRGSGAFAKLQSCSDEEVERHVYKCEVLSKRCFGHLKDKDEGSSASFNVQTYFDNNVCKRLHCENGVLRGNLIEEDDEENEASLFFNVMRVIIALLVFASIVLYACTAGTLTPFFNKSRKADLDRSVGKRQGLFSAVTKAFASKRE